MKYVLNTYVWNHHGSTERRWVRFEADSDLDAVEHAARSTANPHVDTVQLTRQQESGFATVVTFRGAGFKGDGLSYMEFNAYQRATLDCTNRRI